VGIMSFIGGLFTSVQSQINIIIGAIEKPNLISDLTKRVFLVRKAGGTLDEYFHDLEKKLDCVSRTQNTSKTIPKRLA
jgi:hypothetical protein